MRMAVPDRPVFPSSLKGWLDPSEVESCWTVLRKMERLFLDWRQVLIDCELDRLIVATSRESIHSKIRTARTCVQRLLSRSVSVVRRATFLLLGDDSCSNCK